MMNKDNLKYMLYLSSLIYECDNIVKRGTKIGSLFLNTSKKKNDMTRMINSMQPEGFVYECGTNCRDIEYGIVLNHTDKKIVVVFRGSESFLDWYHDLIIFKIKIHDTVKVHGGIYKQLINDNVFLNIQNEIRILSSQYPSYQIFTTGHSLGGALATLFSYLYAKSNPTSGVTCVSFASPRIGNKAFKNAYHYMNNVKHYRCYNSKDIVTAVPNFHYYHTGIRIKMKTDSIVSISPKIKYGSIWRFWSISEHKRNTYCKRLNKHNVNIEEVED